MSCTSSKETEGPFPWRTSTANSYELSASTHQEPQGDIAVPADDPGHDQESMEVQATGTAKTNFQSNLEALKSRCQTCSWLTFRLPQKNLIAGAVLDHAVTTLGFYLEKHQPCIFKIGYTHNAVWRWENPIYGYAHCRDKWSAMVILHVSHECWGPAMLEAALILQFRGHEK